MNVSAAGLRVLVTAGAAGIGRVIATTFADAGASVFVCDVNAAALSDLLASYPRVGVTTTDVSVPEQVDSMFSSAVSHLGGLDVLVNNAGIAGPTAKIEDISEVEWERTIAVDLNSMFFCTRRAVPLLKAAGGGSIVNLSSIAGRLGYPLRTPYSAAKWGVIGFSKSLAIELGPSNIRVNAILPGVVEGDRVDRVVRARAEALGVGVEESHERFVAPISLRRMVRAQDIADMALFLTTPSGQNISGQALSVCGDHGMIA
ncbi:MAG: SDR family oxidoreductase [Proteobacteria bacterium]|jgi:NAD(P)-dependent dehydrogenase (short-subunit alcohol dehydrogenase family)|nr:SDR family oxidoreductase [Pseudomonadota bacterium]